MECDSCWVPDGQHEPAREKNNDEKRTWSKTGSSVARQKCYKLIALDTFNLSSVLKLISLCLDLSDFQPACLSRNSPEMPAALDAVAPLFKTMGAKSVAILDKNTNSLPKKFL